MSIPTLICPLLVSHPSVVHTLTMFSSVQEAWEACDRTDTLFILVCTVFCWPIIPAVGLGYSGYSTRRSGLASFIPAVLTVCVCTIQWFIVGYTLAYGKGAGVIGDFSYIFHRGVLAEPVGTIPAILFSEFQLVSCRSTALSPEQQWESLR
jgi:ammonia channel protein AmtB